MPVFIPEEITEDVVKLFTQKLLGGSGPRGTESEALQGWILKFGEDSKVLFTGAETFINWLANGSPPWAVYYVFMSGRLITLDKNPGIHPVVVAEMWRCLFSKCVFRDIGPEATSRCQDEQICAGLKLLIYDDIHGIHVIWGNKSAKEDWVYLLIGAKNAFRKINRTRMPWIVCHLWPSGTFF